MAEPSPFLSLFNEEIAGLKWFEAFIRGRVELEQQMISGLQVLLEGAPLLPERKLSWHCALEKLLDGTRDELHTRTEKLERLKDQMQDVEMSISKAEMCSFDLSIEFEELRSTECVDSAQAATATSHNDWLDTKSVDVPRRLSNAFSSGRVQKGKLESKRSKAFGNYNQQDLRYRRIVHQHRRSQEQFLNSFPDRVQVKPVLFVWVLIDFQAQEYKTKHWTAVSDVVKVMESFSNYLRDISSTCNSSGSALWASAKSIKPLVDANCHTEAIEFAYHQSPILFPPIYYQIPGSQSHPPSGQTILFGCPLELCTVGELKKLPPVLEYLLDTVLDWPIQYHGIHTSEESWSLVNAIEGAWTGVEVDDRVTISKLTQIQLKFLIMEYFLALPKPVLSDDDLKVALSRPYNPPSQIWRIWSTDPIKAAVLQAISSCWDRFGYGQSFGSDIAKALAQKSVPVDIEKLINHFPVLRS